MQVSFAIACDSSPKEKIPIKLAAASADRTKFDFIAVEVNTTLVLYFEELFQLNI